MTMTHDEAHKICIEACKARKARNEAREAYQHDILRAKDQRKNLRAANCCQNCVHCVREHLPDDPISYFCNLNKDYLLDVDLDTRIGMDLRILQEEVSPEVEAFLKREKERELWLVLHETLAGNVCDDFDLR